MARVANYLKSLRNSVELLRPKFRDWEINFSNKISQNFSTNYGKLSAKKAFGFLGFRILL